MNARIVARFGILTAAALALSWIEQLIPITPGIPGIKLGLSNIVLLYVLYQSDVKSAALLMATKVLLAGFLISGPSAMIYSLAGGVCSLGVMAVARRIPGLRIIGVSVLGAAAHNLGQIAVACLVVQTRAVLGYLPILLVAAVATGILTGFVAQYSFRALGAAEKKSAANKPSSPPGKGKV